MHGNSVDLISWLHQKPADLNLHCLLKTDISGFSQTRSNNPRMTLLPGIARSQSSVGSVYKLNISFYLLYLSITENVYCICLLWLTYIKIT